MKKTNQCNVKIDETFLIRHFFFPYVELYILKNDPRWRNVACL